jgi:hypothetical protein
MPLKISSVEELYVGNRLKNEYLTDKSVYAWLQKRHGKGTAMITDGVYRRSGHEWKVPYGVRFALRAPLTNSQMAFKDPFFVTWISPRTGRRLKKNFMSLPHCIIFVAEKAQYVDPAATIVSKHGFYIPTGLMGKFPRPMGQPPKTYYWCPRCMSPQRFRRTGDQTFYARRKEWIVPDRGVPHYEWREHKLALLHCATCGITNRDDKFRACNQPLEKRKIKKGVRRVKRRKG